MRNFQKSGKVVEGPKSAMPGEMFIPLGRGY
jgi:hypothetical protein